MSKFVFGIDLGTTYSSIAYVDETGRAVTIQNAEGDITTPSVVNFPQVNNVVVGKYAKEISVIEPEKTSQFVKTLMGKSNFAISIDGEDKTPEEISSYILKKLAEDASAQLDTEVKDVVITCPAYFGTEEREATRRAGEIAGLNVLEIISEPTAAAIFYGIVRNQEEKNILVYDLGGGTFDVTIMKISPNKIEVICSDGERELGGKNWDEAIIRYLVNEFVSITGYSEDLDENFLQQLRLKAEIAKQQLSRRDEVPIVLEGMGFRERIILSKTIFDDITKSLLDNTIIVTKRAVLNASEKNCEVNEIVMVGGSTRMPQVETSLKDSFPNIEVKIIEPDEAVCKGAAMHAVNVYIEKRDSIMKWEKEENTNLLGGETLLLLPPPIENPEDYKEELKSFLPGGREAFIETIIVATTKSFALKIMHEEDKEVCNNMILKNVPMPDGEISVTRVFGTYFENQISAELIVYENDFEEEYFPIDEDYLLGAAELELPEGLEKGSDIEVTFTLNREGILKLHAKELKENREVSAVMHTKSMMSEEVIKQTKEKVQNTEITF